MDGYGRDYGRDSFGRDRRYDDRRRTPSPRRRSDSYDERGREMRDPLKEEYLMDIREFGKLYKHKGLEPEELDKRYDIYKITFTRSQNEKLFQQHSQEEWFRERYHPEESLKFKEQIKERKSTCFQQFSDNLNGGKYDDFTCDAPDKESLPADAMDEDKEMGIAHDVEPLKTTALFIKGVPVTITREELVSFCSVAAGFKYLELTDPRPDKRMSRLGWAVFEDGTDLEATIPLLDDKKIKEHVMGFVPQRINPINARSVSGHGSKPSRLEFDLTQIKTLAAFLDNEAFGSEKGSAIIEPRLNDFILPNVPTVEDPEDVEEEDKGIQVEKVKKQLDLYILYLHQVHFYDYYTGVESSSPENHLRRGSLPFRKPYSSVKDLPKKTVFWMAKLDPRVAVRMDQVHEQISNLGLKDVELQQDKTMTSYVRKEADSKFRCTECQKLFRGDDFVRKHIKTKHEHLIAHIPGEVEFFNNFAKDFNKIEIRPPPGWYPGRRNERDSRDRYGGNQRFDRRNSGQRSFEGGRRETRVMKSYHDLDAPVSGEISLNYD
ncbi:Serrate RNA effector molecule [Boothiomyces macroporosus]|uniref:Serrate RNA effector molecule n=1 Tax=Boothiomyces macroporosus TaxID=261099 RepID=A0AAD5UDG8_9FUNG|nr:Serrate RNA effector molecule [Boothiomyces macroporosus]